MANDEQLETFTTDKGRRYIAVSELAKISGLAARDFDLKYRPDHWAHPRDFLWTAGRLWFAILSLQSLFDSLIAVHQDDAAIRLRERFLVWIDAAITEQKTFDGGTAALPLVASPMEASHSPVAPGDASTPAAVSTPPHGAAPVEKSWMQQWEEEREK